MLVSQPVVELAASVGGSFRRLDSRGGTKEGEIWGRRVTQRGEDSTTTCCEYIACYETPTSWNTRVKEGGKLVSWLLCLV